MFRDEKFKLRAYFKSDCSKLALTPEVWTSIQNFSYISLTAHFIDNELKYQKRLLSFTLVPNHTSNTIGQTVEESLRDWGLKNASAEPLTIHPPMMWLRWLEIFWPFQLQYL